MSGNIRSIRTAAPFPLGNISPTIRGGRIENDVKIRTNNTCVADNLNRWHIKHYSKASGRTSRKSVIIRHLDLT